MRGGGGSTYAVLLNYKFKVYPEVPMHFFAFQASFDLVDDLTQSALKDVVTALAENQTYFSDNAVAGYNFYYVSFNPHHPLKPQLNQSRIQTLRPTKSFPRRMMG